MLEAINQFQLEYPFHKVKDTLNRVLKIDPSSEKNQYQISRIRGGNCVDSCLEFIKRQPKHMSFRDRHCVFKKYSNGDISSYLEITDKELIDFSSLNPIKEKDWDVYSSFSSLPENRTNSFDSTFCFTGVVLGKRIKVIGDRVWTLEDDSVTESYLKTVCKRTEAIFKLIGFSSFTEAFEILRVVPDYFRYREGWL